MSSPRFPTGPTGIPGIGRPPPLDVADYVLQGLPPTAREDMARAAEALSTSTTGAMRYDVNKPLIYLEPIEVLQAVTSESDTAQELICWFMGAKSDQPMTAGLMYAALRQAGGGSENKGLLAVSRVTTVAAMVIKKYPARNWEKGLTYSCCFNSAMRHALKALSGEEIDAETGEPHWAHYAWNVRAIWTFQQRGRTDLDDRAACLLGVP